MKLEKAAESTVTRFLLQAATPVLLGLVAFLGQRQLNSIETKQDTQATEQKKQAERTAAIASDVRDLNTRFDLVAVQKMEQLEKRLERVEQAQRTP